MQTRILLLLTLYLSTLFGAPSLDLFQRFPHRDGGPDTRGAIWYNAKNHTVFVADHGRGLWKIDECGNSYGDTTSRDNGLWDISHDGKYIFAVGKSGLIIYDEAGNYVNSLNGIDGEGIYVKKGYAYIVNAGTAPADPSNPESKHVKKSGAKGGIIIVNVKDVDNPYVESTVMTGEIFSQIRGGKVKIGSGESAEEHQLLYVTSLNGKLYLLEADGKKITYKDDITLYPYSEARKLFVGKRDLVYVNSNYGELTIVKLNKSSITLQKVGAWQSNDEHGSGQQSPAAGGVFVKEIKDGDLKKTYALITAANGNSDGYLYWLDVTDPEHIKLVDTLHDTEESYGFNDIWLNDTRIYLAAHDGFCFMGLEGTRNMPVISVQQKDGSYADDANLTRHAEDINDTQTFYVKINNRDGSNALDAKVTAPKAQSGWKYVFYDGDRDITEKITGGNGYVMENIPANSSHTLKILMTPVADNASDATITLTATNKETKAVCGKPMESDQVVLKTTFQGENTDTLPSECTLAFPGALSSTNDEIQVNDQTKIYGTTNHTLITKQLSAKKSVKCDDAPCQKSGTLAKTLSFDLDLGNGKDGDKILVDHRSLTITSDKEYTKFQTGQHNTIRIKGDVTIRSQSDFYINKDTTIDIDGHVTIHTKKFDANQANQFNINGSLKIVADEFYLNSGNKLYNIPSADKFVVLAKKKIDINSQVDFKGLFYSGGDLQVNNDTKITGAMTGNYIDVNDHSLINYDRAAVERYCMPPQPFQCTAQSFVSFNTSDKGPTEEESQFDTISLSDGSLVNHRVLNGVNGVNSIGYNVKDNYIWGYNLKLDKLVRIDANGNTMLFDLPDGLPTGFYIAADVDENGVLYLAERGADQIQRVNVDSDSSHFLEALQPLQLTNNHTISTADFAFNPKDGKLYYIEEGTGGKVYRIDPVTGNREFVVDSGVYPYVVITFFDKEGNFYFNLGTGSEDKNKLYKINMNDPKPALYFTDLDKGLTNGDGARCPNAPVPQKPDTAKPSHFNAWDNDESIDNQVIKTKIVDENITLTIASLDKEGTHFDPVNAKNIKVALFSPDTQLTKWHPLTISSAMYAETTFTTEDFAAQNQQHKAFKAVKAMIQYEENNGTKNVVASTDTFAIRPAKYMLSFYNPSAPLIAGKPFLLTLKATNAKGEVITNYNESKDVYDISHAEVKAPQCITGLLNLQKGDFHSGVADIIGTYSEVGVLKLTASEKVTGNSEYAHIDSDDTTDRFIADGTTVSHAFGAGKIKLLNWHLYNGANHYTYFSSDPLKMGARLILDFAITTEDDNVTQNFTKACYAKDLNVTVHFATDTAEATRQPLATYVDDTLARHNITIDAMPEGQKTGHFSFAIDKARFSGGTGSESLWLNFKRDAAKARNPLKYSIDKIQANVDTASLDQSEKREVTYLYARAYAPEQTTTGKKMNANLFYETYCKDCNKSAYKLEDLPESVDHIYWYILPEEERVKMDFEADSLTSPDYLPYASQDAQDETIGAANRVIKKLEKIDSSHIMIETVKTPLITKIYYKPLSYLLFDPTKSALMRQGFVVHFNPSPKSWAGRGDTGMTVDLDVSPRNAFDKIDW